MKKKKAIKIDLSQIIVYDLETTGFLPEGEIIEIGAIKYTKKGNGFKRGEIFTERIKPETDYWKAGAAKTHNIKKNHLKDCRPLNEVLPEFLKYLDKNAVVVGHRVGFDCAFIRHYCKKLNLPVPVNYVLDTYKIATEVCKIDKYFANKYMKKEFELHLKDLREYFNIKSTLASKHRAYIDSIITAEVFFKLKKNKKVSQLLPEKFDEVDYKILVFERQ